MGAGAFGIWKMLILLAIILLIFGTKKLKNLGSDLGGAIKGFKNAMDDGKGGLKADEGASEGTTIDVKSERVEETR
ncbi:MAG: Sec-independent protein translocase component TatA [Pseudomonadota bacterium]|jgi:sec-independent protein translocase protein TatA